MRPVLWCVLALACRESASDKDAPVPGDPDVVDTDVADTDVADDTEGRPDDSDPPAPDSAPPPDDDDPVADADADAVSDADDACPGMDDRVDLDADAVPDCAETWVPNAQIIGGVDPWHLMGTPTNFASVDATALDANGWAGSTALHVVNLSPTTSANAAGVFSGCAAAGDVRRYDIVYHYRVPSTSPVGTSLQLITSFDAYSDDTCQHAWGSITPGPPSLVFDQWSVLTIRGLDIPPPVRGVKVRIELYKPGTGASIPFELDDVLLQPAAP